MYGSGSGPLGALLVIVPLAAIPVFAIVGVPHFAPLVASPSDDEELVDDLGDSGVSPLSASAGTARHARTADDLFAPISEASSRSEAGAPPATNFSPEADRASSAGAPRRPTLLPPPEALDQWEIRSDASEASARPNATGLPQKSDSSSAPGSEASESLQMPPDVDGKVSMRGFSPELLTLEPTDRSGLEARTATGREPETPPGNRTPSQSNRQAAAVLDVPDATETRPPTSEEQSGWQAAARRLKELGISKYRLESQIEKQTFAFICTISSPDNPRIARRFEADADNPLQAVQLVLEQIDEWRSRDNRAKIAAIPAEEER